MGRQTDLKFHFIHLMPWTKGSVSLFHGLSEQAQLESVCRPSLTKGEGFTCLLPAFSALQMFLRASFITDILTMVNDYTGAAIRIQAEDRAFYLRVCVV